MRTFSFDINWQVMNPCRRRRSDASCVNNREIRQCLPSFSHATGSRPTSVTWWPSQFIFFRDLSIPLADSFSFSISEWQSSYFRSSRSQFTCRVYFVMKSLNVSYSPMDQLLTISAITRSFYRRYFIRWANGKVNLPQFLVNDKRHSAWLTRTFSSFVSGIQSNIGDSI